MSGKNIPKTLIVLLSIIAVLACIIFAPGLWQSLTEQTQTLITWSGILVVTLLGPALVTRTMTRRRRLRTPQAHATRHGGWVLYKPASEADICRAGRWGLLYGFLGGLILDLVLFLLALGSLRDGLKNMIM